jgi:hypothetical protein
LFFGSSSPRFVRFDRPNVSVAFQALDREYLMSLRVSAEATTYTYWQGLCHALGVMRFSDIFEDSS